MSDFHKMAIVTPIFFILFVIVLVNAHNEAADDNKLAISTSESAEGQMNQTKIKKKYPDTDAYTTIFLTLVEQIPKRRNEEWHYEGIPIDVPNRRTIETSQSELKMDSTITTTTKVYPPLNHRYRRIYDPDERAEIEDFPFMAAVLVNKELWCGGAIIEKDRVLTAAHCLQLQYNNRFFREYVKMLTVRVGSTNATAGGEVLRVVEIIFHPNYKPSTLEFNVAVLKLHKNISFSNEAPVQDIEYSRQTAVPMDNNVIFLGWGSVLGAGGTGGTVLLQQVELPVYDIADCQTIYGRELVTHTNFCAGYITKRKNVCNHDAGGPAVMGSLLVGILSFSAKRCDHVDHPAVFTSVGVIAPWLDELNESKPKGLKEK